MKKYVYDPKPKDGRERKRRSFVVDDEIDKKFSQVAKLSGVMASDLLQAAMEIVVAAWEQEHGPIAVPTKKQPAVIKAVREQKADELSAAIKKIKATPKPKRGRKPKETPTE